MGPVWRTIRNVCKRVYPERQIYYRSQGRVRYFSLPGPLQAVLTLTLVLAIGFVAFTTTHYFVRAKILAVKDSRIAQIQYAYDNLSRELDDTRVQFIAVAGDLEAKHRQLVELVQQKTVLEDRLGSLDGRLGAIKGDRDEARLDRARLRGEIKAQRDALNEQIGLLEGALETTLEERIGFQADLNDARKRLSFVTGERNALIDARRSIAEQLESVVQQKTVLEDRLGSLDGRLDAIKGDRDEARLDRERLRGEIMAQRDALNEQIGVLEGALEATRGEQNGFQADLKDARKRLSIVTGERNALIDARRSIAEHLESVVRDLNGVRLEQREFVARVLERTETDLGELEATIALTGLHLDDLLAAFPGGDRRGQGGPLINLPDGLGLLDEESQAILAFQDAIAQLEARLTRWEATQEILQALPLAAPADNYYVSSKYGRRRDPITKRPAFHGGVDMAGPPRTPIRATARGVVTFVGTRGPFGHSVEVDHGFGIKTRYTHLQKILVNKGDEIAFREKIGVMGTTGRSTGTHLHYEVLFNGSTLDPSKFLKAGQYVFKE